MNKLSLIFTVFFCVPSLAIIPIDELVRDTTINFMWINKTKPEENPDVKTYVIPHPYKRQLSINNANLVETIDILGRIQLWAKLNPHNNIAIWYDGNTVLDNAVANTAQELARLGVENLTLIDINTKLQGYEELFEDWLPIYFRVDILRLVATYVTLKEDLAKDKRTFFAYFDLSIDPITLHDLYAFDDGDGKVSKYGLMVGKTDQATYENSFHVMGNNKPNLVHALSGIINKNIIRAQRLDVSHITEQMVWQDYPGLMQLLHALEGTAEIYEEKRVGPKVLLSPKEIVERISIDALTPPPEPLFWYNRPGGINNAAFSFKPSKELKQELNWALIPTRSGISKTSKFNQ